MEVMDSSQYQIYGSQKIVRDQYYKVQGNKTFPFKHAIVRWLVHKGGRCTRVTARNVYSSPVQGNQDKIVKKQSGKRYVFLHISALSFIFEKKLLL